MAVFHKKTKSIQMYTYLENIFLFLNWLLCWSHIVKISVDVEV